MKKSALRPRAILTSMILAATVSTGAAQTGTWTNLSGGSWGTGLNWSGSVIPDGTGAVADFSTLNITANATVLLDGPRTVGTLRFGDVTTASNDWILSPGIGGLLMLDNGAARPVVHVNNRTATIEADILGSNGFDVTGGGTLVLRGANTFTGQTIIKAGATLTITDAFSLGLAGEGNETIVEAGGVLNLSHRTHNTSIGQEIIRISGTGINNGGALVSNGTSNWTNVNQVILDADASIGGSGRWQFNGAGARFDLNGHKLTKVGSNQIAMTAGVITDGDIDVVAGNLSFEAGIEVKGTGTITVSPNAVLGLWNNTAGAQTRQVVLNGGAILRELGGNAASSTFSSPVTLRGNATVDVMLNANGLTHLTLPGGFTEDGGSFGFTKTGPGKLTLNGTNTFTGTLSLNAGPTVLGAAGTLSASRINVGSGATFDVSPAGGLVLEGGRTLVAGRSGDAATDITGDITIGSGATLQVGVSDGFQTLTLENSLTLNGANVTFDVGSATTAGAGVNDLIAVGQNLTLAGTNTVQLRTSGSSPSAGTYTLATYGGTLTGGAANITVSAPGTRQTFTADTTSSPGSVLLQVTGSAGNLTWTGSQNNTWDLSTNNFNNGTGADKFYNLDTVSFTDSSSNAIVNITTDVRPALLTVDATKNYTFGGGGKITGTSVVVKAGTGKLTISGNHDFTGGFTVTGGTVSVSDINPAGTAGPLGAGPLTLAGGTLEYNGLGGESTRVILLGEGGGTLSVPASGLVLKASPQGTTGFTKTGAGTFTADYAATYTGGTVIKEGVFVLNNLRSLGSVADQPVTIEAGATLSVNGIAPSGSPKVVLTMAGDGHDERGALQNYTNGVTNNNIASTVILSGDASIGTNTRYDFVGANFHGGTFTLTKKGTGETWWAPSNADATVGDIIVEAGRFGVQSSDRLGSLDHKIIVKAGAMLSTYNTVSNSKPIVLEGGKLHNNSGGTVAGTAGTWNGTLTFQGEGSSNQVETTNGPIIVNGKITGPGGFEKLGTNTNYAFEIGNPDNDWQGETRISAGTLKIVGSGKFSPTSFLYMGGSTARFDGANTAQTIGGLSGDGTITNVNLTINQPANDFPEYFVGVITGASSAVTKGGAGALSLLAQSTYEGATIVQQGTLEISGSISGSASITLQNDGTLRLAGESSTNRIKDTAGITLGNAGATGKPRLQVDETAFGFSETMGTLSLLSDAVIDFDDGFDIALKFANSSALSGSWTGILEIWNWTSGSDHLFFGTTLAGLTSDQLNQIRFYSNEGDTFLGTAKFLEGGAGEIVPVPEPSALHLAAAALGIGAWRRRRRN